jgi:uncharacterized protein YbjT (DUF2867 family)
MYVVAGVSGNVGSVVARELIANGKSVKVIVRDAKKGVEWSTRGAEVAVGSLDDRAFLTGALTGAAGFFTLLPPDFQAQDFFAAQRKVVDAIAGAVKASGVPHVVMLSSTGAHLESGTGPMKGLHQLEKALRASGTQLTALRAGALQENLGQSIGPARQAGIFPSFVPADLPIPHIATKDLGKLAALSLLSPSPTSETLDALGPAYSNRQLAHKLGQALGKELTVVEVPRDRRVPTLTQNGFSPELAEIFDEMYEALGKGIVIPKGDRLIQGTTPLDETLRTLLEGHERT